MDRHEIFASREGLAVKVEAMTEYPAPQRYGPLKQRISSLPCAIQHSNLLSFLDVSTHDDALLLASGIAAGLG